MMIIKKEEEEAMMIISRRRKRRNDNNNFVTHVWNRTSHLKKFWHLLKKEGDLAYNLNKPFNHDGNKEIYRKITDYMSRTNIFFDVTPCKCQILHLEMWLKKKSSAIILDSATRRLKFCRNFSGSQTQLLIHIHFCRCNFCYFFS